jgi:glucose-6-phosphate isomerase
MDVTGLPSAWTTSCPPEASTALNSFIAGIKNADYPAFSNCLQDADLAPLRELSDRIATRYSHVVFVGMGGSTLGGRLLVDFMGASSFHTPYIHFLDNDDPVTLTRLFAHIPLSETVLIAISKSGTTAETLTTTLAYVDELHHAGLSVKDHLMVLTEPAENPLRRLAAEYDLHTIDHHPKVGGRYSVLSNVGLLPAMLAGMDVLSLRHGARQVLQSFMADPRASTPAQAAYAAVQAAQTGLTAEVLMPYTDRLAKLGPWWAQLWAESLGKNGKGTMPIAALGATDQHSVLQLFADGPNDKFYTFILPEQSGSGPQISPLLADKIGLSYLGGITAGDLIAAQGQGTVASLRGFGRAVRVLETPPLDESVLGQLLMHLMLTTVVAATLWEVNAFDQPAVEDAKHRALGILKENAA